MTLLSPELLRATHQVDGFDCSVASLNSWLRDEALAEQQAGRSRTYVVCADDAVVEYYTVASGSVAHHLAVSGRADIPDPMPVVVLRRLAVDQGYRGRQLGSSLLRDALGRMVRAGRLIGCRAVVVDAPDDRARGFYARFSPALPNQLKLTTMLDFSRIEAGRMQASFEAVDLAALTADLVRAPSAAIELTLNAAVTISLMLHELATNASKYGALSREGGKVEITLASPTSLNGAGFNGAGSIDLSWRERGGPRVDKPSHNGFGSRMIAASADQLGGEFSFDYATEGVSFALRIPSAATGESACS